MFQTYRKLTDTSWCFLENSRVVLVASFLRDKRGFMKLKRFSDLSVKADTSKALENAFKFIYTKFL